MLRILQNPSDSPSPYLRSIPGNDNLILRHSLRTTAPAKILQGFSFEGFLQKDMSL